MAGERELKVSTLELFFDLVYVFAVTQIATLLSHDLSPAGFGRAALALALLWWAWSQYAWALNAVGNEGAAVRTVLVVAMAGSLILAQAVPDSFAEAGVWFAVGYVLVRYLGLATYWIGLRGDIDHRRALYSLLPLAVVAPAVVLAGGLLNGSTRMWVWLGGLCLEVGAALLAGRGSFQVRAGHFAERHGLFVIIALGEAIIAVGVAAAGVVRGSALALVLLAGFAGAVVLWWSYFDWVAAAAEKRVQSLPLERRGRLARDLYTFSHYPIVAGVILYAVAAKKAVTHPFEALPDAAVVALALGFGLFLVGFVLGNLRAARRLLVERAAAIVLVALACALGSEMAAVGLITLTAAIVAAALVIEAVRRKRQPGDPSG